VTGRACGSRVRILTTGGTIASRRDPHGALRVEDSGRLLLSWPEVAEAAESLNVEEFAVTGSHRLTLDDSWRLARRIRALTDDPGDGIVVTHGTDCMEESAFLAALLNRSGAPVIFTGAQRSADSKRPDGPRNLCDAIRLATDPDARRLGVVVAMNGTAFQARDATKTSTDSLQAFDAPGHRPVARIRGGNVRVLIAAPPQAALHDDAVPERLRRVDIIPVYLGVDELLLSAAVAGGAEGIVLDAMGSGNVTPPIFAGVSQALAQGILVAVTSRVPSGSVSATYGDCGGYDLAAIGAVMLGDLKAAKARLALSVALSSTRDPKRAWHLTRSLAGVAEERGAPCF